jgi:hypothetical protein
MGLLATYSICPHCNYVGDPSEQECARPRCWEGQISHPDAVRAPTLLWVVRRRAETEWIFYPPQYFGPAEGSKTRLKKRRISVTEADLLYQGAVRECIEEFQSVIKTMQTSVATLRRLQDATLPEEALQVAERAILGITAQVAKSLTRGANSVTRTLPTAMAELERAITGLAEGGAR